MILLFTAIAYRPSFHYPTFLTLGSAILSDMTSDGNGESAASAPIIVNPWQREGIGSFRDRATLEVDLGVSFPLN